jgi:hypothetical protein
MNPKDYIGAVYQNEKLSIAILSYGVYCQKYCIQIKAKSFKARKVLFKIGQHETAYPLTRNSMYSLNTVLKIVDKLGLKKEEVKKYVPSSINKRLDSGISEYSVNM